MPGGRPTKHTPETQERICQLIRAGNTVEVSAQSQGINPSTFYDWMNGKPAFRTAVEQARAEAESILVSRVSRAAQAGSWRAATWLLERRFPEEWSAAPERRREEDKLDRELAEMIRKK